MGSSILAGMTLDSVEEVPGLRVFEAPLSAPNFLDPNLAPLHSPPHPLVRDRMHLQRNESAGSEWIDEVGAENAIHPGADVVADGLDPEMVPLTLPKRRLRGRMPVQREQPPPPSLVIKPSGLLSVRGVDLHLVSVDSTVPVVREAMAPDLDTRVGFWIHKKLELQNEIGEFFVRGEKAVGRRHMVRRQL